MIAPRIPDDEERRLEVLASYDVLDTTAEASFDELARLAATMCATPMAVITFVDGSRQWFKARVGIDVDSSPRETSFCGHAILEPETLLVPDATKDPRFADNPFVAGEPHVRFYAGAPLCVAGGQRLGTLAVIDVKPRELTPDQLSALEALARQVVTQLELRRRIAENARTEAKLRESEQRLANVIEGSNDGFWDWNVETGEVQFSPRLIQMLGYSPDQFAPHVSSWERLLHPDDASRVNIILKDHLDGITPTYEAEQRLLTADGNWLWVLDRGKVVERAPDGRPLRMAGTHTNISKRKRAERELDSFFYLALELLCIAGFDGYLHRVNPSFEALLGYSENELLSTKFIDHVHPDDREFTLQEMRRLVAGQMTTTFENRCICRDGSIKWIAWTAAPVPEERLIFGAARDVTGQKAAEAALRRSEARTRSIIDNALGGIITTNQRGIVESVNPAAERMFGYPAAELIGRSVTLLLADHYEAPNIALRHIRDKALGRISEWRGRRANGETFPCEMSLFEFYTGGDERYFASHMLDVSERQEIERLKSDFVATVSHELRTPLTSIRGSLGLLGSGVMGELSAEARQLVSVAERNSVRLITLINDILDFEKLDQGRFEFELHPTPVARLIDRSIEAIAITAAEENVRIVVDARDAKVMGDEARLTQVLVNFLSNAVKYSPRGGTVTVTSTAERGWVSVRVRDAGPGIPPHAQGRLFSRFQRIDSSDARQRSGTGLGLAICKAIVEQHGGTIGVESRPGEGSTFWFRVPSAVDVEKLDVRTIYSDLDALLIEDDDALLEVMSTQLAAAAIPVRTARTGRTALRAIHERVPGLIVLDVGLPDMDGFAIVSKLRDTAATRNIPLLVYSGIDLNAAERTRLILGPTRFLMKSRSSNEEFRNVVAHLLESARTPETV